MSADAVKEIREWVDKKFGGKYLPEKANVYKSKKDAQEAHEAIRPTNVSFVPDEVRKYLSDEQYRLYKLIWERAVTSQMTAAVFDQTTVEIEAKAETLYDFRTTGSILKFDGWLRRLRERLQRPRLRLRRRSRFRRAPMRMTGRLRRIRRQRRVRRIGGCRS
jgi:DNA topoisomerase-1